MKKLFIFALIAISFASCVNGKISIYKASYAEKLALQKQTKLYTQQAIAKKN